MCALAPLHMIIDAKIRINSVLQQKNNLLLVLFQQFDVFFDVFI